MDNYIGMTNLNGKNESTTNHGKHDHSSKHDKSSSSSKCWCCRKIISLLCSNIGLVTLILGYSTFGAFVFSQLESNGERDRVNLVISLRNSTVAKLWRITENTNILKEENWTAMTANEIIKFQKQLYQAFREGYDGRETFNSKNNQWSFSGAFLYSLTVITTIGYGNMGPRTTEGKMFTIIYAIIGIPLMILFLGNMGSFLANGFRCFYRNCCTCTGNQSRDSGESHITGSGSLSTPSGGLSHHAHHSHHHLHDHYHVHHIALNDIHANTSHVAVHCNSTGPGGGGGTGNGNNTLYRGNKIQSTPCYGGPGCNAISVSGSAGSGGGIALSPSVVGMATLGNAVDAINGSGLEAETKICPETEIVPEHYTACSGLLLPRHTHGTSHSMLLRGAGNLHHHHGDHINATLQCTVPESGDYRFVDPTTLTGLHPMGSGLSPTNPNPGPTNSNNNNSINSQLTVPLTLCFILIAGYICLGATLFYLWEGWSYLESLYFCFISIATIGLGPGSSALSEPRLTERRLFLCSLYILCGLSLGSMIYNLVQDHVRRKVSACGQRYGIRGSNDCDHSGVGDHEMSSTPAPSNPLLSEEDFDP